MKYERLNECWTCERLKRGECKNPVSTDKKDHGGCSVWKNDELYNAWRAEFGATIDETMKAVDDYLERRRKANA